MIAQFPATEASKLRATNAALLAALLIADEMLSSIMTGGSYPTKEYMDRLYKIRSAIAQANGGQP
jgi:hypothetical protein